MTHEQIQQQAGIVRIVLGAGRPKAFPIVGRRGRMHWEQHQMGMLAEHEYQRPAALFQSYGDVPTGESLGQLYRPLVYCFRRMIHLAGLDG
jgi:hypothetical protein